MKQILSSLKWYKNHFKTIFVDRDMIVTLIDAHADFNPAINPIPSFSLKQPPTIHAIKT